jgi:hypothetical protein
MLSTSDPEPFTQMPISYDRAYGGADSNEDEPDKIATYPENPVGIGFHPIRRRSALLGSLLPNTAQGRSPVSDATGRYRPMSLGPVGRNFFPRYKRAGTYDQNWLDHESPFWPADFSYAYFQCAPDDQQVSYLQGGEDVELTNLTPNGSCFFKIPHKSVPVTCISYKREDLQVEAICDTLFLEPELFRFSLTWRAAMPLSRNLFELRETIVGELPYSWYSKRRSERAGKRYYSNLAEAIYLQPGRRK